MDDFNNSKTPCGAKGFDMWGFYRLKKKEISDGRRADDQLIMKPFFFFAWRKKCFHLWGWIRVTTSSLYKNTSRFFLKRFNHHFSCLCGTSGFLVLVGGKWTQLSPQFTVWLRVDFYKRHFTSLLGFCFRFNSHEVYSAINGTFFLNHDFDILMHYFVLSLKKNK